MNSTINAEFYWTAVALVTVISSARITRLLTFDKFPPVRWLRDKYADWTDGSGWQLLAFCGYCASFWVTGFVVLCGWLSGVYGKDPFHEGHDAQGYWWFVNGVLAASYLAAVFMAHDGDDD